MALCFRPGTSSVTVLLCFRFPQAAIPITKEMLSFNCCSALHIFIVFLLIWDNKDCILLKMHSGVNQPFVLFIFAAIEHPFEYEYTGLFFLDHVVDDHLIDVNVVVTRSYSGQITVLLCRHPFLLLFRTSSHRLFFLN